jgi:hypothetical protein
VLSLLVDTSTWLDLAAKRDGQKWIVTIRQLVSQGELRLLVPELILDEFERNRPRAEKAMTDRVADRFRSLRTDIGTVYQSDDLEQSLSALDGLAHHIPLIGAMTTRNFDDIFEMLKAGARLDPTDAEHGRVVQRGLDKRAPFHRSRNSVADALLIELYVSATADANLAGDAFAFVTSNSNDFSMDNGDKRLPHPDLESAFSSEGSSYALGFDGLASTLQEHFGEELTEILEESDFVENPRLLDEILASEKELFDRIWYQRNLNHIFKLENAANTNELERLIGIAGPPMARVEAKYGDTLGPYSDFEWGMLNGKMSALRWVLGSEWDFLDT